MKNISYIFVIFVLFLLLGLKGAVHAQVNNQNLKTYGCINAVLCNDQDQDIHKNVNCPGPNNGSDQGTWPHRSRIFNTTPLAANADIFVTECIAESEGLICTTGSSQLDKQLFCGDANATNPICDHYAILKNKPHAYRMIPDWHESDYSIYYSDYYNYSSEQEVKQAPATMNRTTEFNQRRAVKTDANGRLPLIEWQAHTSPETSRRYIAFQIAPLTPTPSPTSPQSPVTPTSGAGIGGQQQGTLQFASPTPYTAPPQGCDILSFDPYGRVFDAVSLEPIPQAQVSLLQMDPNTKEFSLAYAQSRNVISVNPQSSFLNGEFSFLVEDGDYTLQSAIDGYSFLPKAEVSLGTNAPKMYDHMYYADSPAIQQRGKIQHRDIPLQPVDGVGKLYDIKIISQTQEPIVKNGIQMLKISGSVSHPFAKAEVHICGVQPNSTTETCNLYKSYTSSEGGPNKYGIFSFNLDQSDLASGQRFRIDFIKVVRAQESGDTASLIVEPIVAYIEGYAYDTDGNILPNARVDIDIPFAKRSVYTTTADDHGYYRITSENLPTSSYTISYTLPEGNASTITTSQFLAQNKEFIEAEGIDPTKYVTENTNPRKNITPDFTPQQKISPLSAPSQKPPLSPSAHPTQEQPPTNLLYLIGAIALLLMGGAGALIALHIYRKKSEEV